jgi:hypothetical protein
MLTCCSPLFYWIPDRFSSFLVLYTTRYAVPWGTTISQDKQSPCWKVFLELSPSHYRFYFCPLKFCARIYTCLCHIILASWTRWQLNKPSFMSPHVIIVQILKLWLRHDWFESQLDHKVAVWTIPCNKITLCKIG